MNYHDLHKRQQITFLEKTQNFLFKYFPVQKQKRNIVDQLIIVSNYVLTYLTLIILILQGLGKQFWDINTSNTTSNNTKSFTPLPASYYELILSIFLVRFSLGLLYIILQQRLILIINKIFLIFSIFITIFQKLYIKQSFIGIQLLAIFMQALMILVWSFKLESRISHFDSRLDFIWAFIKQFLVYSLVFFIRRIQCYYSDIQYLYLNSIKLLNPLQIEQFIIFFAHIFMILLCDFNQIIYDQRFKQILIGFDFAIISLLFSWVYNVINLKQNNPIYNLIVFSTVIFILMLFGIFQKDNFNILHEVQQKHLKYKSQRYLIKYFQTLRKLMNADINNKIQALEIIKFIQDHRNTCFKVNCPFSSRYDVKLSLKVKLQLTQDFFTKNLQNLSKNKPHLKKYMVFFHSPKDKVFRYLDQNYYYMKRQHFRITSIRKQTNNQIKIIEAERLKKSVTKIIEDYLTNGKRFYQILQNQRLNSNNIKIYGLNMLQKMQQIQIMKKNSINYTQSVRVLINNFSSRLNKQQTQLLETVIDPAFLIQKTTQSGPVLLVSAQPQNFLQILDANITCVKQFYHSRQVFKSLTAVDLIPQQIKPQHIQHWIRVSKQVQFDGQKDFHIPLYAVNKLGYVNFFLAVVYMINSIKGRIWCVSLDIVYKMDSLLLVTKEGKLQGISQMTPYFGFKLEYKGLYIINSLFKKLKNRQIGSNVYQVVKINDQYIFKDSQFRFQQQVTLQIIVQNTAFGYTYYIILIKSEQQKQKSRKFNQSLLKSQNTNIVHKSKTLKDKQNNQYFNTQPKFQFYYHSDGVIRLYKEEKQAIQKGFGNISNQDIQEIPQGAQGWGQGITQMRLCGNTLDFLENIETETQFLPKPKTKNQLLYERELRNFNFKKQFFLQILKSDKKLPKFLKYTRIFLVLITLLILSCSLYLLISNINFISCSNDRFLIIQSIYSNQVYYTELVKQLVSYKYYKQVYNNVTVMNFRLSVGRIASSIQINSKKMFIIDQAIQAYFSLRHVQSALQKYTIQFSNLYTKLSQINIAQQIEQTFKQFQQSSLISLLINEIILYFENLISIKLTEYNQQHKNFIFLNVFLIIAVIVSVILLFGWICYVRRRLLKQEEDIMKIFMKINQKAMDKELIKIKLFEEYLYFDKDIYVEEDLEYVILLQEQKKQKIKNYVKNIDILTNIDKNDQNNIKKMNTISISNNNPINFNVPITPNIRPSKRQKNYLVVNNNIDMNKLSVLNMSQRNRSATDINQNNYKKVKQYTSKQSKFLTTQQYQSSNKKILISQQKQFSQPDLQEQYNNHCTKTLVNKNKLKSLIIFPLIWFIFLLIILFCVFFIKIFPFVQISQKILKMNENLHKFQQSIHLIWLLLNQFPQNITMIDEYEVRIYEGEYDFKKINMDMIQNDVFSDRYKQFYYNIWRSNCCEYIPNSNVQTARTQCQQIISGSLKQGADQLIAYFNRKFDYFMHFSLLNQSTFRSHTYIHKLNHLLQKQYLTSILNHNIDMIMVQFKNIGIQFNRFLFGMFVCFVIVVIGFVVLGYKQLVIKNYQKLNKLEKLFLLFEFDQIKNLKDFKIYFKKNYYDHMYK